MADAYKLMLVLSDATSMNGWLKLASHLLPEGGEIHLRGVITMEAEKSLSEGALPARTLRDALYAEAQAEPAVDDEVQVYVDYQPFRRILDEANRLQPDLVLVQWKMPEISVGGVNMEEIFEQTPCDVVLFSDAGQPIGGNVLLSLRGGPNITLGMRMAQALANADGVSNAGITLFHAADARRASPDLDLIMRAVPQIKRIVTAVSEIADGVVREAAGHQALVMGATFRRPDGASSKPIFQQVYERLNLPVALVRGARQEALEFHVPGLIEQAADSLSTQVDRWFAENTFHSGEFSDLQALMQMKEKQGTTISIALPALNEEATVGIVIETLKRTLMDEIPLVDEIVLIDSDSTDNTIAIAESMGVPVYRHSQILTEQVGTIRGKGEALWKSLQVTKGDIVAWVDTDITNIHPRFIYGLIGPLLKHTRVQYVKGYYARPIKVGDKMQAYGGGRVTELVARPLLNLFYPELSGIIQPLSGEYAGRRTALEQVPFFSGYGVETGMLIDLNEMFGLHSIAQSDLEVRVHHNQPLQNLSRMSFAILQVFIARIERKYGVQLLEKTNRSMKMVLQDIDRLALDIAEIGDVERPAMTTLPAYRAVHPLLLPR
ncbi:MAG: glucosyl-3-phosphoglycerate synthase [Anaerolineae bacterium]